MSLVPSLPRTLVSLFLYNSIILNKWLRIILKKSVVFETSSIYLEASPTSPTRG